jgi:glutamate/aspartate transport system ATP-binding protein
MSAPMITQMISIEQVDKFYGKHQVLKGCSTSVAKGEVVVICGPSGSGKSTLIKCVNGLEPFQRGKITVDGVSVDDRATDLPRLRARIGMVFQLFELYPHMNALENVCLAPEKVRNQPRDVAAPLAAALSNSAEPPFFALQTFHRGAVLWRMGFRRYSRRDFAPFARPAK